MFRPKSFTLTMTYGTPHEVTMNLPYKAKATPLHHAHSGPSLPSYHFPDIYQCFCFFSPIAFFLRKYSRKKIRRLKILKYLIPKFLTWVTLWILFTSTTKFGALMLRLQGWLRPVHVNESLLHIPTFFCNSAQRHLCIPSTCCKML